VNDYNGYPAIAMGTNKYFNLPSSSNWGSTLFFVTKPTSSSNGVLIDLGNGNLSNNITASSAGTTATFTIVLGSTAQSVSSSSALTLGQYQSLSTRQATTTSGNGYIYTNGVQVATGAMNPANLINRTVNHIGTDYSSSANFYNGNLLEVLLYNNNGYNDGPDLYLSTRYQLPSAAPSAPIISVPTGTLAGPTQVAISTPADCTCRITLDGSTPSSTSPLYSGPINIYYSQNLKAIALKNGLSSSVSSASYTLDSTQWPAPNPSDTTPLQVNVQGPN
jgi:hypothetical protein